MMKFALAAAGLCALTAIAPASAQDAAANQCRAAAGHVKVFDGNTGLAPAPRGTAAGYDALTTIEGVPGESKADSVRTAREHGSRAAVGRRRGFAGGVNVASGDVNGDGATSGARMSCQNNIKQMGTAAH